MDDNRKQLAKKYEKIKLTVSISEGIVSFILLVLFVIAGYSKKLESYSYSFTNNSYIALLIFTLVILAVSTIISFPADYIFDFRLEHKFNLSNQTFGKWLTEKFKGTLVVGIISVPIGFLFYYLLRNYQLWWLYLACIVCVYTVLLAQIAPILIFPLFYKFKSVENEGLKEKIIQLCNKAGFKV